MVRGLKTAQSRRMNKPPKIIPSLDPLFYNESGIVAEKDEYFRHDGKVYLELKEIDISEFELKIFESRIQFGRR